MREPCQEIGGAFVFEVLHLSFLTSPPAPSPNGEGGSW